MQSEAKAASLGLIELTVVSSAMLGVGAFPTGAQGGGIAIDSNSVSLGSTSYCYARGQASKTSLT